MLLYARLLYLNVFAERSREPRLLYVYSSSKPRCPAPSFTWLKCVDELRIKCLKLLSASLKCHTLNYSFVLPVLYQNVAKSIVVFYIVKMSDVKSLFMHPFSPSQERRCYDVLSLYENPAAITLSQDVVHIAQAVIVRLQHLASPDHLSWDFRASNMLSHSVKRSHITAGRLLHITPRSQPQASMSLLSLLISSLLLLTIIFIKIM